MKCRFGASKEVTALEAIDRFVVPPAPGSACEKNPVPGIDRTYRDALGEAWWRLDPAIRRRFSVRPRNDAVIRYAGTMNIVWLSWTGWLFAQVCRLFGMPLAPETGEDVPMGIELVEDKALGGTSWRRIYHFPGGRNYTVSSTKVGSTGDECIEYINRNFLMRLRLTERAGALVFTSTAYEVRLFGRNFRIPSLVTPGVTTVTHEQLHGEYFRFSLSVDHPLLGRNVFQDGEFYSVSER